MCKFKVLNLGLTDYKEALNIQLNLVQKRIDGLIPDVLILLEHPPTITIGRSGSLSNLLVSEDYLIHKGIHFEQISRGGDITFHGPGQIVGYPIMDLNYLEKDIHKYLRSLEYLIIDTLKTYNINSSGFKGITGVWTNGKKIASIGVGVRRWITYHGFALNVNNNLEYFNMIIPCGLNKVRMTNIISETDNHDISIQQANEVIIESFAKIYERKFTGMLDNHL